jgi:hypothetical protein
MNDVYLVKEIDQDFIEHLKTLDASDAVKCSGIADDVVEYETYKPGEPILLGQNGVN